jgi:hypothetical protein
MAGGGAQLIPARSRGGMCRGWSLELDDDVGSRFGAQRRIGAHRKWLLNSGNFRSAGNDDGGVEECSPAMDVGSRRCVELERSSRRWRSGPAGLETAGPR